MIYVNGSPLNVTIFPDNTSQVWKVPQVTLPDTNYVHIVWDFTHEGEFMHLAQLKLLLTRYGFRSTLRLKNMPYGRQDKTVSNDTTFALHAFALVLNSLMFEEVIIHDPHSSVAIDLINNSKAVYPFLEIQKVIDATKPDTICYPDHGAVTKYSELPMFRSWRFIYGEKERDQLTGKILSYKIIADGHEVTNFKGKNVLIVDDICDGGATFKILSEKLRISGVGDINLFVTHGIFSKGLKTLRDSGIKRIFTQDGEASEVQNKIAYRRL